MSKIQMNSRTFTIAMVVVVALGLSPAMAQVIPTGPQISVKEYPGFFFDRGSDIAVVDLDGNFVIVWAAPNMREVRGQRYDTSGVSVGSEFVVASSSGPYYPQLTEPSVAGDFAGNFVVAWERARQESPYGGEEEVLARRFDGSGPVGSEFNVSNNSHRNRYPQVSGDGNSNFVVVWERFDDQFILDANNPGVLARRFDPSGNTLGAEIAVSTNEEDGSSAERPEVGTDLSGNFVVVWEFRDGNFDYNTEFDDNGVAGRRFDSFGVPLDEAEFVVNTYTTGSQQEASVGVGLDGNFVVAWQGEGNSDDWGIFGKQFAATGGALADEFLVNTMTIGFQSEPTVVAADEGGHFVVSWHSRISAGDYYTYGRWFRSDSSPFEDQFEIPTHTNGDQEAPRIAGNIDGNFVVLWNGEGPADEGLFARLFEQPVLLSVNDFSIQEGDSTAPGNGVALLTVEASRSHPSLDVSVEFTTEDQSAGSFDDYTASEGAAVFDAGTSDLTAVIDVPIIGDDVYEPDEDFLVHLGNVENAAIVRDVGIVTIVNDDDPPGMTIADASMDEGNSGTSVLAFRVDLTEVQQEDATVDFATSDGTASAGSDYQASSGTLTIPGGSTTGFIGVEINGDFTSEGDETLTVTLANPSNGTLLRDTATGSILGDDCVVAITIDPPSANLGVGGGSGSITVTDSAGCGWTASSNQPWLMITSPSSGVGNATVGYSVSANADAFPRNGAITIAGMTHTVIQDGLSCSLGLSPMSADFSSGGGNGSIAVTDPADCGWTAVSNDPWLVVTSGASGTGAGTVEYTVDPKTDPGDRSGTILITGLLFTVNQEGSFFDHFDDNVLSPSWVYSDAQFWSESNSFLEADVLGMSEESQAIATPAFGGCTECTITARLGVNVFALGEVTMFGWYMDATNFVGLTMNEFANEWTLFQVVGGVEVQSVMTDSETIGANTQYDVELSFDGDDIIAAVDGDILLIMQPWQGTPPSGTVGFHATGTIAEFDLITVLTKTAAAGSGLVFGESFEGGDFGGWSSHSP